MILILKLLYIMLMVKKATYDYSKKIEESILVAMKENFQK